MIAVVALLKVCATIIAVLVLLGLFLSAGKRREKIDYKG